MPPKISLLEGRVLARRSLAFVCPTCQFRALSSVPGKPRSQWPTAQHRQSRNRRASTVAPISVVNATKHIPLAAQDLHDSLSSLKKDASVYTSLSQLQLALRGLESENPVTRIAILGISGPHGARRLARVLLADPLAAEPAWEKQLTDVVHDQRAILLRYGETTDYDQRHPLLRVLTIPSMTLQTHRLEILIQAISPMTEDVKVEAHNYLVPVLETTSSSAARYSVVRYPVHKALVFGDGLTNVSAYTPVTAAEPPENKMLKGAINTRWIDTLEHESDVMVVLVNIDHAEAAITTFRQSLENSVSYEHTWFSSGLPNLSTWLLRGLDAPSNTTKPTIYNLVCSLLSSTESRILASETERLQKLASTAISPSTRTELSKLITAWSEKAHTELRDQLSLAFSSPAWRKLAWWKLPLRVDDVEMTLLDILQRSWLTSAEKELIWLVGRIEQAGLFPREPSAPPSPQPASPNSTDQAEVQAAAFAGLIEPSSTDSTFHISDLGIPQPQSQSEGLTPYPQSLSLSRTALSRDTIPPLQSLAQKLVLQALSTTFLTSTLSILLYISISTTSLYEAGAIAALGAVYSARRLQKRWEGARGVWMEAVREEGRAVLRDEEGLWRGVVEHGKQGKGNGNDDGGVEERKIARKAVERVRAALERSRKSKGVER